MSFYAPYLQSAFGGMIQHPQTSMAQSRELGEDSANVWYAVRGYRREPNHQSGLGPSAVVGSAANAMLQGQLRQQCLLFGQLWICVLSSLVTLPCLQYARVKVFHFSLHMRSYSVHHRMQVNQKNPTHHEQNNMFLLLLLLFFESAIFFLYFA